MSNRKSSITAELKLTGAQGFKTALAGVGNAAKKAGQDMKAIRPPDVSLSPTYQYWKARERGEKTLTAMMKAEADKRLKAEQAAALELRRIRHSGTMVGGGPGRWNHLDGTQFAGGTRGSGSAGGGKGFNAYGLGVGYNAVQDLVQGGPMAIANNIPQILDLVSKSPALKNLGAVAVAGAAGYFAYDQITQAYDKHSDAGMARRRMAGSIEIRNRERAYNQGQAEIEAGISGEKESEAIMERLRLEDRGRAAAKEAAERDQKLAALQQEYRKEAILQKKDESEIIKGLAELEIQTKRKEVELAEERAMLEADAARKKLWASEAELENTKAQIEAITNGNRRAGADMTDDEKIRLNRLQGILPGQEAAKASANSQHESAISGMGDAAGAKERLEIEKRIIEMRRDAQLEEIRLAQEAAQKEQYDLYRGMKRTADENVREIKKKQADEEKNRQTIRDQIRQEEEMAGMSPRKRAKAEEEEKKKARIESLKKEGFTSAEASDIAGREAKLAKPRGNRIRGAGYGGEDGPHGLGAETYGGLNDLAAMQPNKPERRTITGAGAKKKEDAQTDKSSGGAVGIWNQMLKAMESVRSAVDRLTDIERGKPVTGAHRQ